MRARSLATALIAARRWSSSTILFCLQNLAISRFVTLSSALGLEKTLNFGSGGGGGGGGGASELGTTSCFIIVTLMKLDLSFIHLLWPASSVWSVISKKVAINSKSKLTHNPTYLSPHTTPIDIDLLIVEFLSQTEYSICIAPPICCVWIVRMVVASYLIILNGLT